MKPPLFFFNLYFIQFFFYLLYFSYSLHLRLRALSPDRSSCPQGQLRLSSSLFPLFPLPRSFLGSIPPLWAVPAPCAQRARGRQGLGIARQHPQLLLPPATIQLSPPVHLDGSVTRSSGLPRPQHGNSNLHSANGSSYATFHKLQMARSPSLSPRLSRFTGGNRSSLQLSISEILFCHTLCS